MSLYAAPVGLRVGFTKTAFDLREARRTLWEAKWELAIPTVVCHSQDAPSHGRLRSDLAREQCPDREVGEPGAPFIQEAVQCLARAIPHARRKTVQRHAEVPLAALLG